MQRSRHQTRSQAGNRFWEFHEQQRHAVAIVWRWIAPSEQALSTTSNNKKRKKRSFNNLPFFTFLQYQILSYIYSSDDVFVDDTKPEKWQLLVRKKYIPFTYSLSPVLQKARESFSQSQVWLSHHCDSFSSRRGKITLETLSGWVGKLFH